jgi:hypothetical protein
MLSALRKALTINEFRCVFYGPNHLSTTQS